MFSNSIDESSLDDIRSALISPLFLVHSFRKLFKILLTKNILFFLINYKKKFFKSFEKLNSLDKISTTLF